MLLVKTYLNISTIPGIGIGCFAGQNIQKGEKIWQFNPLIDHVFSDEKIEYFTDLEKNFIKKYSFKSKGLYYLCVDNARFFNHSEENCNTIDPSNENATYASRDIKEGEEILSNYKNFGVTKEDLNFNIDLSL